MEYMNVNWQLVMKPTVEIPAATLAQLASLTKPESPESYTRPTVRAMPAVTVSSSEEPLDILDEWVILE